MLNTSKFHYLFYFFYILQGSVATCVNCGENITTFLANFLINPLVKKIEKSAKFWQTFERIILWVFVRVYKYTTTHCESNNPYQVPSFHAQRFSVLALGLSP